MKPKLFKGGIVVDNRGSVSFNNNLTLNKIKRFYIVKNKKKILLELGMDIKSRLNSSYVLVAEQKYLQLKLIILRNHQKNQKFLVGI